MEEIYSGVTRDYSAHHPIHIFRIQACKIEIEIQFT